MQLVLFDSPVSIERVPRTASLPEIRVATIRECFVGECNVAPKNPEEMAALTRTVITSAPWYDPDKECVVVFCLNAAQRMIAHNLVSIGTLTTALCMPREVLRPVIAHAAAGFVIVHTHPSGSVECSAADIFVTRRLREAARAVEIPFIDHLILGDRRFDPSGRGYYSFKDAGIL